MLNGLGGTKYEELFGAWAAIERQLERNGLTPVGPEVGEFVTSLDMAGWAQSPALSSSRARS
jgi:dihydroxyacetone kinase